MTSSGRPRQVDQAVHVHPRRRRRLLVGREEGRDEGRQDLGFTFDYQASNNDPAKQAQLIEAGVSAVCQGIAVSAPNPDAIKGALGKATAADISKSGAEIQAKLESEKDIDGIFSLNADIATGAAIPAAEAVNRGIKIGTVDLSGDAVQAIKDGKLEFAIDQQQYGRRAARRRALHGLGGPPDQQCRDTDRVRGDRGTPGAGRRPGGRGRAALRWWERGDAPGVGRGDLPGLRPRPGAAGLRAAAARGAHPGAGALRHLDVRGTHDGRPRHARWQTSARAPGRSRISWRRCAASSSRAPPPPSADPQISRRVADSAPSSGVGPVGVAGGLTEEHIPQYLLDDAGRRHNRLSRCRALACRSRRRGCASALGIHRSDGPSSKRTSRWLAPRAWISKSRASRRPYAAAPHSRNTPSPSFPRRVAEPPSPTQRVGHDGAEPATRRP